MDRRYEELLNCVERPGRYIGGEINAIVKDWNSAELKIALIFPDIYDIGMSHLGIRILYHILNGRPNILCERAFAPWVDMEGLLRSKNLPIVTLENKRPLKEFDIIGFSLSHELNYTNVLNILDLSGIPLRSKDRGNEYPLIIAGGPCAFNPEPMAEFIDIFLIGDGEDGILDIADCYLSCLRGRKIKDKKNVLKEFSKLEGVYAPTFYEAKYKNNIFTGLISTEEGIPQVIRKRSAPDLEQCFYPTKQILSYIPLVHDRVSLEVMRGCPHRCRFCQATTIYSPKRLRSRSTIMHLARETQKQTGHNEISLLSLSTGDYPGIIDVLNILVEEFRKKGVSISLPSLRIEKGIEDIPPIIKKIKKTGFTFAPEVGSKKLKNFINKNIDSDMLLEGARNAYEFGWRKIKLYFMIGFAGEDDSDLDALVGTVLRIADLRAKRKRRRKEAITLSISSFIPKPHTPFQWEAMALRESLIEKIKYIKRNISSHNVKINAHNIDMSTLEAILSRGDRKLSAVIETAFLKGARFDNWSDLLKFDIWEKAFLKCGIDSGDYLRARTHSEHLPWDHINAGISKGVLARECIIAHRAAAFPN